MRSDGYLTVVAVGELMPYVLDAVIRQSLVVAVGSVSYGAVKTGTGYHEHVRTWSCSELELTRRHTALMHHISVLSREYSRSRAHSADVAVEVRSCNSGIESLSAAHRESGNSGIIPACLYGVILLHKGHDAVFEVFRTDLGALKAYQGCNSELTGEASSFKVLGSYYLRGSQLLDFNYIASHDGKMTESDMRFNGVLKDESMKTFRGTLDFKSGCSGAVGAEYEDVMLLTDGVGTRSLPIILCGEEDVVGEHGASVGQIPDVVLFYLMSRGFSREACENMLINSRLNTTISKISDEEIKKIILDYLKNKLDLWSIDEE